jgi:ribosomal protein S18 acetylase RimI-like enzyme
MEIIVRDVVPSDAPCLAHIVCTANDRAFRGLVPDQCLEFSEAESTSNWERFFSQGLPADDFMLMAETSTDECLGYIWAGRNTKDTIYQAELRQINILPSYQGHGLGRRLVRDAAQRLTEKDLNSMRVEVMRINPNRIFYERLGAQYVSEHPYDWDSVILSECVYGWSDIRVLLAQPPD